MDSGDVKITGASRTLSQIGISSQWYSQKVSLLLQQQTWTNLILSFHFLFCNTVPKQNGFVDCGLYACKYAESIYNQRHRRLTFQDLQYHRLARLDNAFEFDHDDIKRFRKELQGIIENLSGKYSWTSGNTLYYAVDEERTSPPHIVTIDLI